MPYIKPKDPPYIRMRRLLLGYELNAVKLAQVLGCTAPTARGKLRDPQKLTLEDLGKINRVGHIPIEEIREAIQV